MSASSTRRTALVLFLLLVCVAPIRAQSVRFVNQPPDCDLARKAYDNPFSDSHGFVLRRYQWHAFYAALSTGSAEALHRITGWPRWSTALITSVGIGVVPHLRQTVMAADGHRTINARDWAFDAFIRSAPLILRTGRSARSWQSKTLVATRFVGGYLTLACFASP
jgi:hypothetical protein